MSPKKSWGYQWVVACIIALTCSLTSQAQITVVSSLPTIKSCVEADTVRVVLTNTGSSSVDSVRYNPSFPSDVTYVKNSVSNANETSTTNLNSPTFTYPGSIAAGDSVVIKYVIQAGCDLDDKNKFPTIQHSVTRFVASSSTSQTTRDTLSTFVVPDLAIASFSIAGGAYTYVGDTVEIKIKLSNQSFADVESFDIVFTALGLDYLSTSLDSGYQSGNYVYLKNDTVLSSKTDFEFSVKFMVNRCSNLSAALTVPWGCSTKKCNTSSANINVSSYKTVPSSSYSIEANYLGSKFVEVPVCKKDTLWFSYKNTTPETKIVGQGNIFDLKVGFTNYKSNLHLENEIIDSIHIFIGDTVYQISAAKFFNLDLRNYFTRDIDGSGGLTDIDGDGFYDDLKSGDSIVLGFSLTKSPKCLGLAGTATINDSYQPRIELNAIGGCSNGYNIQSKMLGFSLTTGNSSNSGSYHKWLDKTNVDTSSPVLVRYQYEQFLPNPCARAGKVRTYFVLPPDVYITDFKGNCASGTSCSYSLKGDTLVFEQVLHNTDTSKGIDRYAAFPQFKVNTTCETKTRQWKIEYITTFQCDTTCSDCEYVSRRGFMPTIFFQPCESSGWCTGPNLTDFSVGRFNLGFDSISPFVDITANRAITKSFLPYDTMQLVANGYLNDTTWDSLWFVYQHFSSLFPNKRFFNPIHSVLDVYDASGTYKGSCSQFTSVDSVLAGGGYQYTWNLSNGTCATYPSLKKGDSLAFKVYFLVDSISMPINTEVSTITDNISYFAVDSAGKLNFCNYLGIGDLTFYSNEPSIGVSNDFSCGQKDYNKSTKLCTPNGVLLKGRFGYIGPARPFGEEYRPFIKFNKVKFLTTPEIQVIDSFIVSDNYALLDAKFEAFSRDTIYHTRSGDTLIYNLKDSILPYGFGMCGRDLFGLYLPIKINCNNRSGNYYGFKFWADYETNYHGDTSKIVEHKNVPFQKNLYYHLPNPGISLPTNSIDAYVDTNYWEMRIWNQSNTEVNYHTLFLTDSFNGGNNVNVFKVTYDGVDYFPTIVNSKTVRFDFDSFNVNHDKKAKIYFTLNSCDYTRINYDVAFGCDSITLDYPDNQCLRYWGVLNVDPKPINPKISIIEEPSTSTVDLCDLMRYKIEMTNSQVAQGHNLKFSLLPPAGNGFSILSDSSYYYFENDTNKHFALGNPVYDSINRRYFWSLASNYKLNGVNVSNSSIIFSIAIAPNCNFTQNDFMRFQASAFAPCNDSLASNIATGGNIVLNNIEQQVSSHFSRSTIESITNNVCDTFAIRYSWVNIGNDSAGSAGHADPDTTTTADFMQIQIPDGLNASPYRVSANTTTANGLVIHDSLHFEGITYLKIGLPSGLDKGDSLSFDLKFVPSNRTDCSDTFKTSITNFFVFKNFCSVLNDTCRLTKETGYAQSGTIYLNQKWEFDWLPVTNQLLPDTSKDLSEIGFQLVSKNNLVDSKPIRIAYYYDANKNNSIDASDSLITLQSYARNLTAGDTVNVKDTLSLDAGWACNLIISISSDTNCICETRDTVIPSPIIPPLSYSDSLCFGVSDKLLGQKLNNNYTYKWTGGSSDFTYTDTTETITINYVGDNPDSSLTYIFYRNITMASGCTAKDSVELRLDRTPVIDLGPDIHQCNFDTTTFSLTPYNYTFLWHDTSTNNYFNAYQDDTIWVQASNHCGSDIDTVIFAIDQLKILSIPFFTDSIQCKTGNFFLLGSNINNFSTDTITYFWDWKDGNTSSQNPVFHRYNAVIDDSVKLIASNAWCIDSMQTPIKVVADPISRFTINKLDTCLGTDSFHFVIQTSIDTNYTYQWIINDDNPVTLADTLKTSVSDTGTYTVKLVVSIPGQCSDTSTKSFTVYPVPQVSFNINDSLQCLKDNLLQFSNTSSISNGSINYLWKFGNGDTSTANSPNKSYSSYGVYTVNLIATSDKNCTDSTSKPIEIYQQPTAAIDIIKTDSCLTNNSFDFLSKSYSASDSVLLRWDISDGTTSKDTALFDHDFTTYGSYEIRLVANTANGCSDTTSDSVTVYPNPIAQYAINDSLQCLKNNVYQFTNASSVINDTNTYQWSFGDGNTSTSISTSHSYNSHGVFQARLIATSSANCHDTIIKSMIVYQQPEALIQIVKNDSCFNSNSFDLINQSTIASDSMTFAWDFGNGNFGTDTSYTNMVFDTSKQFIIQLITTSQNGCIDTTFDSLIVYPNPIASFTIDDSLQCLRDNEFSFTNTSIIESGSYTNSWKLGDGNTASSTSVQHSYSTSGNYVIELISTSNHQCKDSATDSVEVFQQPSAGIQIIANDSCYGNNGFDFVHNASILSDSLLFNWNFGDGNVGSDTGYYDYSYVVDGKYLVQLIVSTLNGCSDSITDSLKVHPLPIPSFSINDSIQCLNGNNFVFTNNSTITNGSNTYNWNFGDGTTFTTIDASHSYTKSGLYYIQLIATSDQMCIDSITDSVMVHQQPVADFTIQKTDTCLRGNTVDFIHNASIQSDSILFLWDLDDGNFSTDTNIYFYTYQSANTYDVSLKVSTLNGCKDSTTKPLTVYPMPVANLSANDTIQCYRDHIVNFTNNSTLSSGSITHYFDFDNGTSSSLSEPSLTYSSSGIYNVMYVASSDEQCKDTQNIRIEIQDSPTADFNIDSLEVCEPNNLFNFNNTSSVSNTTLSSYWEFSDGYTSMSDSVLQFSFTNNGTYTIQLISVAANTELCADTITKTVNVLSYPTADFSINDSTQCLNINDIRLSNTGSAGAAYLWTFGNGNSSTNENPNLQYTSSGTYTIKLVTSLHNRCRDSLTKQVEIYDVPEAAFNLSNPTQCFEDHSFDYVLTGPLYNSNILWDFGDGNSATDSAVISYKYNTPGSYEVKALVNTSNCSDSAKLTVEVYDTPVVQFEGDSVCLGETISFTNNSTISTGTITGYRWQFGDNATSNSTSPTHTYTSPGLFQVILEATSDKNCVSADTANAVRIYPKPDASIFAAFTELIDAGQVIQFTSTSTGAIDFIWYFDDNTTQTGEVVNKTYSFTGNYSTLLVASNEFNCIDSARLDTNVTVPRQLYIPNSFSPNNDLINDVFKVNVRGEVLDYKLEIFNRWGERLFSSNLVDAGWDGTYMGKPVHNGVYIYVVFLKVPGDVKTYSGTLEVLR